MQVLEALEQSALSIQDSHLKLCPIEGRQVSVSDLGKLRNILQLISSLEEHDDVQSVHSNLEIQEESLQKLT